MEKRNRHSVKRNARRDESQIIYPADKRCSQCKTIKPCGDFPKARREKDGLKCYCKACGARMRHNWYVRNREQEIKKTVLWCRANPDKVRKHARKTYLNHHESRKSRNRLAYEQDKENILSRNRDRYNSDTAYRDKKLTTCKEYYAENKNKTAVYQKKYRAANRDRLNVWSNAARSRKVSAPGSCSPAEWQEILKYFNYHCAFCLKPDYVVGKLSMDHMTPLTRGGSNAPENIVPACKSCNCSKNNRTVLEFVGGMRPSRSQRTAIE